MHFYLIRSNHIYFDFLQGSNNSDHLVPKVSGSLSSSGGASAGSSNSGLTVPPRIHSILKTYLSNMEYLTQAHDLWDQAEAAAGEHKGRCSLPRPERLVTL